MFDRLRDENEAAKRLRTDEGYVARALGAFGPLWDMLWPGERARILGLLVERIDHDGRDGQIAIRLRAKGVGTLTDETA